MAAPFKIGKTIPSLPNLSPENIFSLLEFRLRAEILFSIRSMMKYLQVRKIQCFYYSPNNKSIITKGAFALLLKNVAEKKPKRYLVST